MAHYYSAVYIAGMYAGNPGTSEPNVHQRTVDYPEDFANGFSVMLDTELLVTGGNGLSWCSGTR